MMSIKIASVLLFLHIFFSPLLSLEPPYAPLHLQDFDYERDADDAARILYQNHELLFGTPSFNVRKMLAARSLTPDIADTHGSLQMLLLKKKSPDPLLGFIAYEANKQEQTVYFKLLVICAQNRSQGLGAHCVKMLIEKLKNQGYAHATFETRAEKNKAAVVFYDRIFARWQNIFMTKKPIEVPNKEITDVVRYTITLIET